MNKKVILFFVSLVSILTFFSSCSKTETGFDLSVSEEWKAYQGDLEKKAKEGTEYPMKIASFSGNGEVYAKITSTIKSTRVTSTGTASFNDSVVCRYTGWYYKQDGKKHIFDTTEGNTNSQQGRGFRVNGYVADANGNPTRKSGILDGWTTILQQMKVGDEREVCIPHLLGYGVRGEFNSRTGVVTIPGYTTLFFTIKLVKIVPLNPDEFPDVTLVEKSE